MPSFNLGIAPIAAGQGLVFSGVSLNVNAANSVEINSNRVQLAGDVGAPGNSYYYGTNSVGVKGYHLLTGAGGGGTGGATSDQLTQTGVILGARIDTVVANLGTTGTTLLNYTNNVSGALLTQIGISGLAISGGLQAQINATGQTAWTHSDNNGRNLSGRLTQTGQEINVAITGLSGYLSNLISASSAGVSTLNSRSGHLIIASAGVGIAISNSGQTIFVSGTGGAGEVSSAQLLSASGDLLNRPQSFLGGGTVLTGNTVYWDTLSSNRTVTFASPSGVGSFITLRMTVTGGNSLGMPESYRLGDEGTVTGIYLQPGNHEISWIRSDNKWWLADSASPANEYDGTRGPSSIDDVRSGYLPGASYFWDSTVSGLYVNLRNTTSGAVWHRINNPTGIFGQILLNGALVTVTGSSLYINGNLVSGSGGGGTGTPVSVTGSSALTTANFIGAGNTTVYMSGGSTVVVSGSASVVAGGTGMQTGVSSLNGLLGDLSLVGAGTVTVTSSSPAITISGSQPHSGILSPGFDYQNGNLVTVSGDPWIANRNVWVYATGGNLDIRLTGIYDGFNGTVIVEKRFNGTGEARFSSNSKVVNATGQTSVPLSYGSGALDVLSFVHNNLHPTWAVSTLSGTSQSTLTFTGSYSAVTVTGSSLRTNLNVIGAGSVTTYLSGENTLVVSGLAGGADGVGTGTMMSVTGSSFLPIVNVIGLGSLSAYLSGAATLVLSGSSSTGVGIGGGTGTFVSVTGSSALINANFIGAGNTTVYMSGGSTVVVSGSGGGAGEVTQAQLLSASGDLLNRPQMNLAGGSVLTGNTAYFDSVSANRNFTFAAPSGGGAFITLRMAVTGARTIGVPDSYRLGEEGVTTGIFLTPGNHEISWIRADNKWWMADSASVLNEFEGTRAPLSTDDNRSGYAAGASYYFEAATSGLYVNLNNTTSGSVWYRINSPTGIFGSIILNGQTVTATGSALYINGAPVSGAGGGGGTGTLVSVTGSSSLTTANFVGAGNTTVYLSGGSTVVVSGSSSVVAGGTGMQTGVSSLNGLLGDLSLVGAGTVTVTSSSPSITVSGSQPHSGILSPGFNYQNGNLVTVSGDPWIANRNVWIYATGGNLDIRLTGIYDGFNGTVIVEKRFNGTGEARFSSNSKIVNATGQTSVPLSYGSGALDVLSFVHNNLHPTWAVSTLSGASQSTQTFTGSYSAVTVTGSSLRTNLNVIGAGSVTTYLSGENTLVVSGLAGGADGVGTGTMMSVTGSSFLPIVNVIGLGSLSAYLSGAATLVLSGASSTGIGAGGGTGTFVSVTGSSALVNANFIGAGNTTVYMSGGSTVVVSGLGGGAGEVTQAQLLAASGDLLNRPQSFLGGGTVLTGNTVYWDALSSNRTLTFASPSGVGSFITLRMTVTGGNSLGMPESYRVGDEGSITGIYLQPGNHEISWIRSDNKWWLADSASPANEYDGTRGPASTDDVRSGYFPGASYFFDSTASGLYVNLRNTTSGAAWYRINNPTGTFDKILLNGALVTVTGSSLYINGNLVSGGGGGGGTGTLVSVTGSSSLTSANFIGAGNTTVYLSGASSVIVSGSDLIGTGTLVSVTGSSFQPILNIIGLGGVQAFLSGSSTLYITGATGLPVVDGDKGHIIVSNNGTTWTVDPTINLSVNALLVNGDITSFGGNLNVSGSLNGSSALLISATQDVYQQVNRPTGKTAGYLFQSQGTGRWGFFVSSAAETGNNGGSNFVIARYGDNGSNIGEALNINRATSTALFEGIVATPQVSLSGNALTANTTNLYLNGLAITGTAPGSGTLSPGFTYISGGQVTITSDPGITSKNYWVYATGNNVEIRLTGIYDGFNGTVIVEKRYEGTGEIRFSSNSKVINARNQTAVPLSYYTGSLDALSFVHNNLHPTWAVSSLTGETTTTTTMAVLRATGNFLISGNHTRGYLWSGADGLTFTGTLGTPSVLSGEKITVKNISANGNLLLSGLVDYDQNYVLSGKAFSTLWSDSLSWIRI